MFERSKGDVSSSRVNNNNANRVVKNPLLSASVTGLSFDDFPNKPLLLPAAPPVVHAPPPQPTNALIAGILNREPKTLVTVGHSSIIDDNETLDEINLNASSSDDSAIAATASINPYLNAGDANANPLLEPTANTDSLLSQAASSFGALPAVASNVFSTFSKRIYAGNRETEDQQPQLDIQPTYIQQVGQVPPAVPPFYAAPPTVAGEAAPEPPKLYAPTELPQLGAAPTLPPTSVGQNTYRITARKKLYAPIPGLSEQQQQQQQQQQPPQVAFATPPYPVQAAVSAPLSTAPPEERKSGGGLFSLTNLVPTGVLQNISGLVQSATGRTTNEPAANPPSAVNYSATNPGYFDISTSSGASNYFAPAPPVEYRAPPPVGGYFNPLAATAATETVAPPVVGSFFNPPAASAGVGFNPPTVGGFFAPATATVPPGTAAPPAATPPPAVAPPPAATPPVVAPPSTFAPPAAAAPPTAVAAPPTVDLHSAFAPPSAQQFPPGFAPPPSAAPPTQQPPPAFAAPPSAAILSAAPPTQQPPPTFAPPPSAAPPSAAPPPSAGLTSYRLQKGTRLYKSPLTAQETAPPTGFTAPTTSAATAAIFNPFGGVANTGIADAASTPAPFAPQSNFSVLPPQSAAVFAPLAAQEVPLFPNSTAETAAGLLPYPPAAPRQIVDSSTPNFEVPLFAAPPTSATAQAAAPPPAVPQTLLESAPPKVEPLQEQPHFAAPPTSAITPGIPFFAAPPTTQAAAAPPAVSQTHLEATLPKVEPLQQVPLFAAPPTSVAASGIPLFAAPPTAQAAPAPPAVAQTFPEPTPPKVEPLQELPLFAAPPTSVATQEVPLFASSTAETAAAVLPFSSESTATKLEAVQPVPLFAAPPNAAFPAASLFASSNVESLKPQDTQELPLFAAPPTTFAQSADLFASAAAAELTSEAKEATAPSLQELDNHSTPLFVPVPSSEAATLYPPAATESSQEIAGESTDSVENLTQSTAKVGNYFAPTSATAESTSNLFAAAAETSSVALSTQTTTTFFNPFAQTITTPLPQDLLPPPIGFVATEANQLFESQTIEPVQEEIEKAAAPPPPPTAAINSANTQANPFRRRDSESAAQPAAAPTPLQSFFTPATDNNSSDFNFFAAPPKQEAAEPPLASVQSTVQSSHALGFEQLISDSQQFQNSNDNVYQNSSVNTFSGYFGGTEEEVAPPPTTRQSQQPLTHNFFDHFAGAAQGQQEDQRIQNFFNNPPLQDQPAAPGELKYDLVHSGLPSKHFEDRSQTSVSNLVEPPSSACSEFSSVTKAAAVQQQQQSIQPQEVPSEKQVEDLQQLYQGELPEEILQQLRMANEKGQIIVPTTDAVVYTPVLLHWFYKRSIDGKFVWTPFSHYDSALLETSLTSDDSDSSCIVPVEGGRYDVNIKERTKTPVFWEGKAIEVRRCSWFYKAVDSKYVPYAEETAAALEAEYKKATETGEWLKKIPLANGEQVTMHGPSVIVHFMPPSNADSWGGTVQSSSRPLVVKRDLNDFKIQQGESQRVDHLLFMVHGIGSACDLKMRNVEEVVDDFRIIAQQLVQSHYKNSTDMGLVGRVEVLPIEWHGHLHSEELGIDEKLKSITLESIPRLRNFTNDTLLDVLFYTSPKYCQKIMNTVADALNEVYLKYRMRHPEFNGGVSLAGHSLGSLILFDLLCHQESLKESEEENKENPDQLPRNHNQSKEPKQVQLPNNDKMLPKQVSYAMGLGPAGTGQPVINYTQLIFHPKKFFALGSPIGMFVTIRGIDKLGLDFRLPTCPGFYNIFHPFDPVAYRIEALVNPDMKGIRPVLIPHHKGRKRMHLELKETMTRVGADIKQRFMDTFKTTLDSVHFLATVTKVKKEAEESLEKAASSQAFQKQTEEQDESSVATTSTHARNRSDSESTTNSDPEFIELDFPLGKLNDSKRVDYVLQEAPLEFINEYIFALSSHVCYWSSEDTILFVMKEIYAGLGISTDSQVPQQSMTIERPSSRTNSVSQSLLPM